MAFPRPSTDHGSYGSPGQDGMTLRDYFAAAALPTMIHMSANGDDGWNEDAVAAGAYLVADAMLAARATKGDAV
jgi:hypothetical protein